MTPLVSETLEAYAEAHTSPVTPLLEELRRVTHQETEAPQMQVGPVEGTFLSLLVHLTGARRVLEVGTFTGYSALMMASALPPDGRLVTLDRDPEALAIARRFFARDPAGARIRILEGEALDSLSTLDAPFDLCFLDADKEQYPAYYERLVDLLRPGGLLVVDNVLWSGRVADPEDETPSTRGIRALNDRAASDPRVTSVLLTVRDGMLLVRRR